MSGTVVDVVAGNAAVTKSTASFPEDGDRDKHLWVEDQLGGDRQPTMRTVSGLEVIINPGLFNHHTSATQ